MAEMTYEDIAGAVREQLGGSDEGRSLIEAISRSSEFSDRQLDQAWKIAQLQESGANSRASMSAGASRAGSAASAAASRYSADASRANAKLAAETQRYGIDTTRLTDQEKIALDRELGYGNLGIQSGQLGLGYLDTASKLRGPENYLQAADFMRGAAARQDVPIFMQSLLNGGVLPGFQAPGGSPQGLNIQGLMQQMGFGGGNAAPGVGGPPNDQNAAFLAAVRAQNAKGLHTLAPGTLERWNPSELGAYISASEYGADGGPAWNWDDLLQGYKRAGIGQGNPMAA